MFGEMYFFHVLSQLGAEQWIESPKIWFNVTLKAAEITLLNWF